MRSLEQWATAFCAALLILACVAVAGLEWLEHDAGAPVFVAVGGGWHE